MQYRLKDLTINLTEQTVHQSECALCVTGLNFRLLAYLIEQGTRVASYDDIIDAVWSPSHVNNDTVTQRIRLLRVALNDTNKQPAYIRSVRGVGYQLCCPPTAIDPNENLNSGITHAKSLQPVLTGAFIAVALAVLSMVYLNWPVTATPVGDSLYDQTLSRAQHFLHQRESEDIDRALTLLAKIETRGSGDPEWLIAKSLSLSTQVCRFGAKREHADYAEQLARQAALYNHHKADALAAVAYSYDCRGDTSNAINGYREAIASESRADPGTYSALAYLLGETGQIAESLAIHKGLETDQAERHFLYLQLARNYALLQYNNLAAHYYKLSFDLYPENPFSNVAYPTFLFSEGLFKQAEILLNIAEARPHHSDLYLLKAELHLAANSPRQAQQALEQAVGAKSDFPFYQTLLQISQPEPDMNALRSRLAALSGAGELSQNPTMHLETALLHSHLNNTSAAQKALTHAVRAGYLNTDYLMHSHLYSALRELPDFDAIVSLSHTLVAQQRDAVPEEFLAFTAHE
mgnify:CR=1 FL=1